MQIVNDMWQAANINTYIIVDLETLVAMKICKLFMMWPRIAVERQSDGEVALLQIAKLGIELSPSDLQRTYWLGKKKQEAFPNLNS